MHKVTICLTIGVGIGLVSTSDPTICCTELVVPACNRTGAFAPVDNLLGNGAALTPDGFVEALKQSNCWCQNNGAGPPSPTRLTCRGILGALVLAGYNIQTTLGITNCHCECIVQGLQADPPCPPPPGPLELG